MAYIGTDGHLAMWKAGALQDDALAESCVYLLRGEEEPEEGAQPSGDGSRGFIIQDWFGPFLLGPQSRFLRGRC
jgi:hypothetical protein